MNLKTRICQSVVVAYGALQIVSSAYAYATTGGPTDNRVRVLLLIGLTIQAVFCWGIIAHPKSWSFGLGILFSIVAVTRVIRFIQHNGPNLSVGDLPIDMPTTIHVVLVEGAWILCAIACFLLRKEITKEAPNQAPDPTPPSGAGHL